MIEQNKISWEEKIKLIFDEDNWEKNRDLINLCNSELSTEFTDWFIKYIDEKISSLNKKCNDLQNKKEELNKKEEELLNEKELLNMKYIDLTTIKEAINKKITFMKREYWKKAMCRSEEQEQSILNKFYEKNMKIFVKY